MHVAWAAHSVYIDSCCCCSCCCCCCCCCFCCCYIITAALVAQANPQACLGVSLPSVWAPVGIPLALIHTPNPKYWDPMGKDTGAHEQGHSLGAHGRPWVPMGAHGHKDMGAQSLLP